MLNYPVGMIKDISSKESKNEDQLANRDAYIFICPICRGIYYANLPLYKVKNRYCCKMNVDMKEISLLNDKNRIKALNDKTNTVTTKGNKKEGFVSIKTNQTQESPKNESYLGVAQTYSSKSLFYQIFIENVKECPQNLTDPSIHQLRTLLNRKLGGKKHQFVERLISLIEKGDIESLNRLIKGRFDSEKRKDEQKKFIYRNVVKSMKVEFMRVNKLSKSKETERIFWDYYFKAYAFEHNIPIAYFSDPLNSTFAKNEGFKYIKDSYFTYLFNNSLFFVEFEQHLNRLKEQYLSNLSHKIDVLFESIEKEKTKGTRNKRIGFKFPWSISEIEKAVKVFKTQMEKYRKPG